MASINRVPKSITTLTELLQLHIDVLQQQQQTQRLQFPRELEPIPTAWPSDTELLLYGYQQDRKWKLSRELLFAEPNNKKGNYGVMPSHNNNRSATAPGAGAGAAAQGQAVSCPSFRALGLAFPSLLE